MDYDFSFDDEEETRPQGSWLEGDSLAPPCQSDMSVVYSILSFAHDSCGITTEDVLYDLGCGDGRICIEAARLYGCRAVGCEIEEDLVEKFRNNVEKRKLQGRVKVLSGDLREIDLSDATIIVLYLLPEAIVEITAKLHQAILTNNARVICNTWGPKSWTPARRISCGFADNVNLLLFDRSSIKE